MGMKTERTNWRVEVDVPERSAYGLYRRVEHELETMANEIRDQIRRHVDTDGPVRVVYDIHHRCEHCGYAWAPDDTGENGCCDKDIQESDARKAAQASAT